VSGKKRDLHPEEKKLWRKVAASVKTRRPAPADDDDEEEAPLPTRKKATASAGPAPSVKPAARAASAIAPQDRGNEKRVRRGRLEIDAKLDLHGHTQDSARAALVRFLHASQRRGDRIVIIITGVGRIQEGVLKRRLPEWLAAPEVRSVISGYAPAHRTHGGAGAVYVFLKRPD
jgi:DNA-nicking Smr family endonuclease